MPRFELLQGKMTVYTTWRQTSALLKCQQSLQAFTAVKLCFKYQLSKLSLSEI